MQTEAIDPNQDILGKVLSILIHLAKVVLLMMIRGMMGFSRNLRTLITG
jgi:hypothetical protein